MPFSSMAGHTHPCFFFQIPAFRPDQVQHAQRADRLQDGYRLFTNPLRDFAKDPGDFLALFIAQPDDGVVDLYRFRRLDEERRTRVRRAVNDARHAPAILRLQRQHHAIIVKSRSGVLKHLGNRRVPQQPFEHLADTAARFFDRPADREQLGAGVVAHTAALVDDLPDSRRQLVEVLGLFGEFGQRRHRGKYAVEPFANLRSRPKSLGDLGERFRLERRRKRRRPHRIANVVNPGHGRQAALLRGRGYLAHLG